MKKCFKCGKSKDLSDFYKHKQTRDGHLNKCKTCTKHDVKSNDKEYEKTKKGVVRVIYKTQKANNKKRGFGEMPYSKAQLSLWLHSHGFELFYDNWVRGGYSKDLKPSVDRIDDFKGYSFDNIRLTTWLQNRLHQYDDRRNGEGTSGKVCKRVIKIDQNFNVLCEYRSYNSASADQGYSIEYAIKKGTKCKKGFYWKYKEPTMTK